MEGNHTMEEEHISENEGYYEDQDYDPEMDVGEQEYDEDDYGAMGGSEQQPVGGIYALFDSVMNKKDSTKVSNLDKEEIGNISIDMRNALRIANLSNTFNHKGFGEFFKNQAKIISDTAMSKNGWFTELFITSKKYASSKSSAKVESEPSSQSSGGNKFKLFSKMSKK